MTEETASIDAVIGLGANLGDRRATLDSAIEAIGRLPKTRVVSVSRFRETKPVGPPQPVFLNAAILVATSSSARELLDGLLGIEASFGRVRRERWGPRTLDLDILWMSGLIVDEVGLSIPHPALSERRFALEPLLDVAPAATDPRTGEPYADILRLLC